MLINQTAAEAVAVTLMCFTYVAAGGGGPGGNAGVRGRRHDGGLAGDVGAAAGRGPDDGWGAGGGAGCVRAHGGGRDGGACRVPRLQAGPATPRQAVGRPRTAVFL